MDTEIQRVSLIVSCSVMKTNFYRGRLCMYTPLYMYIYTAYVETFGRRKFSPISPSALIGEIFITQFFVWC